MNELRVVLHGASGRMGQAVQAVAAEPSGARLIAAVGRQDDLRLLPEFDVAIDFSLPEGLLSIAALCSARGAALVSGTTGLSDQHQAALEAAAQSIPVLHASNFSIGIAALARAVADLAARLDWDCEIVEAHHAAKRDAPSGTALRLAEAVNAGRNRDNAWVDRIAESETSAPRAPGSLGIASLRGGRVVGDHSVFFFGPGERIECCHRADDRAIFARGAWQAAQRLVGRPPGRYRLEQVLWP